MVSFAVIIIMLLGKYIMYHSCQLQSFMLNWKLYLNDEYDSEFRQALLDPAKSPVDLYDFNFCEWLIIFENNITGPLC